MNKFKLSTICFVLLTTLGFAQQKLEKATQRLDANKDATINLNTSYTNVIIENWNRNEVQVEAYIESDELSREELEEVLSDWQVQLDGTKSNIEISTKGGSTVYGWSLDFANNEALEALQDLKLEIAEMPEFPEMPEMPELPELNFEMPEMPAMPDLPELPEGVHSINFDNEKYKKEGESYLEKWSQEYEEKYGAEFKEKMKDWAREFSKVDFDKFSIKMEKWGEEFGEKFGEKFGKDMEKWGEEFAKNFDDDWAKKMEKWGEEFGEKFGKEWESKFEERNKRVEERLKEREVQLAERQAKMAERLAKREEERAKRHEEMAERLQDRNKQSAYGYRGRGNSDNSKVKRTILIKKPKDAKLKVDIRHGELKLSSTIENLEAKLKYAKLYAERIDGSDTSINASYSPVYVDEWVDGNLDLSYTENTSLKKVNFLTLTANSSNISIDELSNSAMISGSFGDLLINKMADSFKNLNIILENSDALVNLPKSDYHLIFQGNRSKLNNERTDNKTIKNGNQNSGKTIMVNAKFSNVIMQ